MLSIGLLVAALCVFADALGQGFCSEPVEPYCVSADNEFDTLLQVNRCQDDLLSYEQEVAEYEQCVAEQIEVMRRQLSSARQKLKQAESRF